MSRLNPEQDIINSPTIIIEFVKGKRSTGTVVNKVRFKNGGENLALKRLNFGYILQMAQRRVRSEKLHPEYGKAIREEIAKVVEREKLEREELKQELRKELKKEFDEKEKKPVFKEKKIEKIEKVEKKIIKEIIKKPEIEVSDELASLNVNKSKIKAKKSTLIIPKKTPKGDK